VIKESGELALSWVKNYAYDLCITNGRSEDPLKVPEPIDIHLHLPAGATKKDGPSAGVAMVRLIFLRLSFGFSSAVQDSHPDSI
jgi:ATP-dependent Lon protease